MKSSVGRVLIFGGSFDPVHRGHLESVRFAQRTLRPDLTILIPSRLTPLKERPLSSPFHRVRMLALAVAQAELEKTVISRHELRRQGPSYTIDTVRHFAGKYPRAQIFLLIGSDQANQFDLWKDAHLFKNFCSLVCVRRNAAPLDAAIFAKYGIRLLNKKPLAASSTELRSRVFAGMSYPAVDAYINENLLYLEDRVAKWLTPARWAHTQAVVRTAQRIARANGFAARVVRQAAVAGFYHDIAKDFADADLRAYADKYMPGTAERNPELLHALVGADYVVRFYGMRDAAVVAAIMYHTLPVQRPLHDLTKIIYVADKVEPGRKYPLRARLCALALQDLDQAFAAVYCVQYERFNQPVVASNEPAYRLYARLKKGVKP